MSVVNRGCLYSYIFFKLLIYKLLEADSNIEHDLCIAFPIY